MFNWFKKKTPPAVIPAKKYKVEDYTEEVTLTHKKYKVLNTLDLDLSLILADRVILYPPTWAPYRIVNEYVSSQTVASLLYGSAVTAKDKFQNEVVLKTELINGLILLEETKSPVLLKKQRVVEDI